MIRVLIVDDHPVVREGLRSLLSKSEQLRVVGEAGDGLAAIDRLRSLETDVVLLDWMLPRLDGLETCRRIKEEHADLAVLMLTNHLDQTSVKKAIQAGATGYLLKDVSFEELEAAILDAARGKTTLHAEAQQTLTASLAPSADPFENLTGRERDVLILIATGHSNKEIGNKLNLTEGTVKGYVSTILTKTNTADRTQAALLAVKVGLVPDA